MVGGLWRLETVEELEVLAGFEVLERLEVLA
jgi:hypothetical protein